MTAFLIVMGLMLIAAAFAFPKAKIPGKIMTTLSEGVPMVAFCVVFITFMITIVSRYVLRVAVPWTYEISILGYMYCMFFGSGIAITREEHVCFSLLYDKLNPLGRMISKLLYNALLIALICVAFVPSAKSILNMKQITGILKMPYKYIFLPFLWMLVECAVRSFVYAVDSVKEYIAIKKGEIEEKGAEA